MELAETKTGTRWMRVGRSSDSDAVTAGREAATLAVSESDTKLLIVFCSDSYDLKQLLSSISATVGDVPLIGCSTAGEIAAGGPGNSGVVITAIGGSGFEIATSFATGASERLRAAGAEVAGAMAKIQLPDSENPRYRALLLLTDGLAGDQQEIVRGAYSVLGAAVPLVGGCAGDDLKMKLTHQFYDGRILENAVVGAAIVSTGPIGIGVKHGWSPVGDLMLVTRSVGTCVHELDDRPALDAYLELLDAPAAAHTDPDAFTRFAATHPIGMAGGSEEAQVRFVTAADFETRSFECISAVPQGHHARFMRGTADSVLNATDAACDAASEKLGDQPPLGAMVFDCIARKEVLGTGIKTEVDRIAERLDGAPISGFYTYGEIARTRGIAGFHNQTLVVLALG